MRHHRRGPSKRLAPTVNLESTCPHEYREDEGLQLEIDCSSCPGAHDLVNAKCLVGIVNTVSSSAPPDVVILKRYLHKRYRGESLRCLKLAALELSSLTRALSCHESPSDKRCRTCCASRDNLVGRMKRALLADPANYLDSHQSMSDGLRALGAGAGCPRAAECVDQALSASALHPGVV